MSAGLKGLKVLDLTTAYGGAWCGRLLADFGADVVVRDPHPVRNLAPFDGAGVSIPARYVLANRKSVQIDGADGAWQRLFTQADVVIDTAPAGSADRRWIDTLMNPEAVHAVVTPHGLSGARAGWPGNEMTADALSGWASVNGLAGREPLKASGFQAAYQAGTLAFGAILCALIYRHTGGEGQQIDVAMDEVLSMTFAPGVLRSLYQNAPWPRRKGIDFLSGPVPCKDGYFAMTLSRPHFWTGAMRLLGLDDLADDERLHASVARNAHKDEFVDRVQQAMLQWRRADLFAGLSQLHVVAGPVFTVDELERCEQLRARSFFSDVEGIRYPGPGFRSSRGGFNVSRGLAAIGADTQFVLAAARPEEARPEEARPEEARPEEARPEEARPEEARPEEATQIPARVPGGGPPGDRPLSGYRGIVLTQAWAGTLATQLLGLMGAEIVQVESRSRFDSWRGNAQTPMPEALRDFPTAKHPWNCNALFNSVNLNKESVVLELSRPEGVEAFKALAAEADFVAENFSPRVMGKLGIGYDTLRRINPGIVMLSISGFGHTGPWSSLPAIGGTIEPSSGMSSLLGYAGGEPMNSGQMYPDPVAALYGFAAVALALYHRCRTGEGQHIDLSMQEANLTFIGEAWMEYALTGKVPGPRGNRHHTFAPHGIYPCRGDDRWIAIAAETEAQWHTLCELAERPEWRTRFADNAARLADADALDEAIADWTRACERDALAHELAGAGVVAAPVLNALEVAEDPVYRARGNVVMVDHPEAGVWPLPAIACVLARSPARVTAAAPLKGAHSREVFARLLGMQPDEYEALEAAGITGVEAPH